MPQRRYTWNASVVISPLLCIGFLAVWRHSLHRFDRLDLGIGGTGYNIEAAASNGGIGIMFQYYQGIDHDLELSHWGMRNVDAYLGTRWSPGTKADWYWHGFEIWAWQAGGTRIHGVIAPAWFLGALSAAIPVCWLWKRQKLLADIAANRCTHCGYDLRASRERCPECGKTPIPRPADHNDGAT